MNKPQINSIISELKTVSNLFSTESYFDRISRDFAKSIVETANDALLFIEHNRIQFESENNIDEHLLKLIIKSLGIGILCLNQTFYAESRLKETNRELSAILNRLSSLEKHILTEQRPI